MYIIEKCPEFIFHVEQFVLAATPFFVYRNLLFQLLKVVHTPIWGFKMTKIIELVVRKPFPSCYRIICSSYRQKTVYTSRDKGDYLKIVSLLLKVVDKSLWG